MSTRSLEVDRSDLADTAQPEELAELLIAQLAPQLPDLLPLPIEDVARACGILDIQPFDTDSFEGGLIQDETKKHGYILVRAGSNPHRSRYTVAHELGHFVNLRHVAPPGAKRLMCTKEDFKTWDDRPSARHGMESQANEFAACVLMPRSRLSKLPLMAVSPEMNRILELQNLCDVSKVAAARRYAELHGGDFAVVFSLDGKFNYAARSGDFPRLNLQRGQALFRDTTTRTFAGEPGDISDQDESDASWWLDDRAARRWTLWEEVLLQSDGYRITLLLGEREDDD